MTSPRYENVRPRGNILNANRKQPQVSTDPVVTQMRQLSDNITPHIKVHPYNPVTENPKDYLTYLIEKIKTYQNTSQKQQQILTSLKTLSTLINTKDAHDPEIKTQFTTCFNHINDYAFSQLARKARRLSGGTGNAQDIIFYLKRFEETSLTENKNENPNHTSLMEAIDKAFKAQPGAHHIGFFKPSAPDTSGLAAILTILKSNKFTDTQKDTLIKTIADKRQQSKSLFHSTSFNDLYKAIAEGQDKTPEQNPTSTEPVNSGFSPS
jgi:hypothetical protein